MTENQGGRQDADPRAGRPAAAGVSSAGPERPFLQRPQGVLAVALGVVGVIGGVLGLVFLLLPDLQPKPTPEPEPGVELVDVDLEKEARIEADWIAEGAVHRDKDWKASLVTVILRNSGDNPALVSQAEFRFSSVTEVGCRYGAGGTEVKARYDIKVPIEAAAPFNRVRKMKYTLPPHEQERIAFTVGPESLPAGTPPLVYTFGITLHLDDKSRIEIPEMTYMDPSNTENVLWSAERAMANGNYLATTAACVKEQERRARELIESPGKVSPELKRYSAELTRIVGSPTQTP